MTPTTDSESEGEVGLDAFVRDARLWRRTARLERQPAAPVIAEPVQSEPVLPEAREPEPPPIESVSEEVTAQTLVPSFDVEPSAPETPITAEPSPRTPQKESSARRAPTAVIAAALVGVIVFAAVWVLLTRRSETVREGVPAPTPPPPAVAMPRTAPVELSPPPPPTPATALPATATEEVAVPRPRPQPTPAAAAAPAPTPTPSPTPAPTVSRPPGLRSADSIFEPEAKTTKTREKKPSASKKPSSKRTPKEDPKGGDWEDPFAQ